MHDQVVGPVSVSKCAELLTAAGDKIDRSALSRYCDSHGLKLGQNGKVVLVDFETVRQHRAENYTREVQSGQAVPLPLAPAPAAPVLSPTQQIVNMEEHRGLKAVQLRRELREEAKEEGLLTETAEVEAGVAEAIVEMRSAFSAARSAMAETMVARFGLKPEQVRVMRDFLRQYDRTGQTRFAERMARALVDGNEETGEAGERLTLLAAVSIRMRARRNRAFAKLADVG